MASCLDNYENWIKQIKREIMETEAALQTLNSLTDLDREYLAGTHDRALCLLEELGEEHNFEFCHKEYDSPPNMTLHIWRRVVLHKHNYLIPISSLSF